MKHVTLPKKVFFLLSLLCLLPHSLWAASGLRLATDTQEALSAPDAHFSKNMWIFTSPDDSGISQVYYQWVDSSTTASSTSEKVQLTFNTVNASDAKFGSDVQALRFAETAGGSETECNGTLFFYLADVDADSKTEIRMGCINATSLMTSTPDIVFDVKLTGYSTGTTFNVKSYDVARLSAPNLKVTLGLVNVDVYPVVFTDTSNRLHMLLTSGDNIYADRTNLRGVSPSYIPSLFYNYSDGSEYFWDTTVVNSFGKFFTPKFDSSANTIVYSIKPTSASTKQLGTITIKGLKQLQITNFNRHVLNPSFHGNSYPGSSSSGIVGVHVFFELSATASKSNQFIYLPVIYTSAGAMGWCNTAAILTDSSSNRSQLRTTYGTSTDTMPRTLLLYQKEASDGKSDTYLASTHLVGISSTTGTVDFFCDGAKTRSDGTTMLIDYSTAVVDHFYDITADVSSERELTCMNDNTDAVFLPAVFHDGDFNVATSAENGLDIVLHRTFSDGSGEALAHLYNADDATGECADTCYETADGTPIVDSNTITDGDGIADSCESVECADLIESDLYGDADADGFINHLDNCPCNYNPDQADSDSDDWGDACDIEEDECGTVDTDGDGTFDTCDQCPNDADYTTLAYDVNGDGVNDSCVPDFNECGTEDADSDGIFDGCDSCVNGFVPTTSGPVKASPSGSPRSEPVACEEEDVNECGSVDTDGDGTFDNCDPCPNDATLTVLAYDVNGDGIKDSCAAPVSDCGSTDSDGDGVFNSCDACPNDDSTSELLYDVDGDGTKDSCVQTKSAALQTKAETTNNFDGGFVASGGLVSCALTNDAATTTSSAQTLLLAGLGLALFGLLAQRYKKQAEDKRRTQN